MFGLGLKGRADMEFMLHTDTQLKQQSVQSQCCSSTPTALERLESNAVSAVCQSFHSCGCDIEHISEMETILFPPFISLILHTAHLLFPQVIVFLFLPSLHTSLLLASIVQLLPLFFWSFLGSFLFSVSALLSQRPADAVSCNFPFSHTSAKFSPS